MKHSRNETLIGNARALRKNMTKQESALWYQFLRFCKPRFRRQEIIGNYIADFFCQKAKLVIEIDGSQHYEPTEREKDNERSAFFHKEGIKVVRFSNTDVDRHFDSVCQAVLLAMENCGINLQIEAE